MVRSPIWVSLYYSNEHVFVGLNATSVSKRKIFFCFEVILMKEMINKTVVSLLCARKMSYIFIMQFKCFVTPS